MYSVIRLLDTAEQDRDRVLTAVREAADATGAHRRLVEPTLAGVRNGGDVLAHMQFESEAHWRSVADDFSTVLDDRAVTRVNGAGYTGTSSRNNSNRKNDNAATVYRTLLLRVLPAASPDTVAQFENDLRAMPRYVTTMTAWQLSRVCEPIGTTPWTHVFEQEFTDVDGLMGPYLMHPIHWAVVDRWFDPECPDVIIRDRVCHSFCAVPDSVLT